MTSNKMDSKMPGLNPNDVLMGRGSGANLKQGNIRFRQMVCDKYDEEMARIQCKTMEAVAAVKIKVANDVLQEIKSNGGRFLRKSLKPVKAKEDSSTEDLNTKEVQQYIIYEEVSDKEATEKIKQTLRFQIERRKGFRYRSWRGGDPEGLFYLSVSSATALFPGQVPATENAVLRQSIDDRLLQMISQSRISRLLQGTNDNNAVSATDAPTWPPLLSAAAVCAAAAKTSKQSKSRRLSSLQDSIARQDRPNALDTYYNANMQFPSQPTIPRSPGGHTFTSQTSSCLAIPSGNKTSIPTLERLPPSASNQLEMEALIRREELELMLDRIRTQRLTSILHQSMTQPPK
jgi:hypothetical protein